jgi:hypothetical protein
MSSGRRLKRANDKTDETNKKLKMNLEWEVAAGVDVSRATCDYGAKENNIL